MSNNNTEMTLDTTEPLLPIEPFSDPEDAFNEKDLGKTGSRFGENRSGRLIKARKSEGRERAKRAGIRMGRKPKLSAHQIAEVRDRKAGGESVRFLARSYGVSPNTISRVR
jgi:hypothetical protein